MVTVKSTIYINNLEKTDLKLLNKILRVVRDNSCHEWMTWYSKDNPFPKLTYKCNETSIKSKQYYLENKNWFWSFCEGINTKSYELFNKA